MPENKNNLEYINNIRGIAICMVILVHTTSGILNLPPLLKSIGLYGQTGVQLFFLASAFTLCLSLERTIGKKNWLLVFYIKRYFRIAPLYYLGILIYFFYTYLLVLVFPGNPYYVKVHSYYSSTNILANVLFIHGFYSPANNIIVPGGWSIGTEMGFYLIFPLLYILIKKTLNYLPGYRSLILILPYTLILIGVTWAMLSIHRLTGLPIDNNNFLYYNVLNQLPVFLLGIIFYFYNQSILSGIKNYQIIILFAATTLVAFFQFQEFKNITLVPFWSGLSFVFLFLLFQHIKRLNTKVMGRIGELSFSIYLFHFLFAEFVTKGLSKYLFKGQYSLLAFVLSYLIILTASVVIAMFSEKNIEKRGIQQGAKLISRLK